MRKMQCLMAFLALGLFACGGSSDSASFAQLSAAANQAETSATALGNDAACHIDADCSALVFAGVCGDHFAPLSLLSPNADRAVALAGEQREFMQAATSAPDFIAPPCLGPAAYARPAAACVQAQCTLRYSQPTGATAQ